MKGNQQVIITRGLSGSGKTTWSNEFVRMHKTFLRVSRDDIDFMLSMSNENYNTEKEELIFHTRDFLIGQVLSSGFNLVLDETYLVPKRITQLNFQLQTYVHTTGDHLDVSIEDFIDMPLEECIKRDRERFFHVGEEFIRKYYEKYIIPLQKNRGVTEWTI